MTRYPATVNHMDARQKIVAAIVERIRSEGWTQAYAAEILGVSQPRVSDLLNKRAEKFSLDALVNMVDPLGMTLDIWVR